MTAASADVYRKYEDGDQYQCPAGVDIIYKGTPAGLSAGYAVAGAAGLRYAGWNRYETVDNSAGSAGDKKVTLERDVHVQLAVTGVVGQGDQGKFVHASDDSSFTLSPGAPGATMCIGRVARYVSAGVAVVHAYVGADVEFEASPDAPVPAEVATAGAATLTVAQLKAGLILRDPAGGNRSDVTPTAALIVAAFKDAHVGKRFRVVIRNTADAAETITLTGGDGVTISGTATIAQNNSKEFLGVITNATEGSEAVTLYSLGTVVH